MIQSISSLAILISSSFHQLPPSQHYNLDPIINNVVSYKNKPLLVNQFKAVSEALTAQVPDSATNASNAGSSTNNYSQTLQSWLLILRTCESGGNYQENTGNGFYGAYQFTIDTWNHWQTGYDRADLAPPDIQDATIIQNTLNTPGLSTQNPGCYISQGLSNYPPD